MNQTISELHSRAISAANLHKRCEAELLTLLQEIDERRAYLQFDVTSLYDYCAKVLKLSEGTSYNLMSVARKSREVPALKDAIVKGEITVSKAKKIVSVINVENQNAWLQIASRQTSREIEKAVAKVNPQLVQESVRYKSEDRLELNLGISERLLRKLERAIDLESQRTSKPATREEVLEAALDCYLAKNDPIKKAERHFARQDKKSTAITVTSRDTKLFPGTVGNCAARRKPLAAHISHALHKRDKTQCTHVDKNGNRCATRRWLHAHHIVPIAVGGTNEPQNLITLCSAHHRLAHSSIRGV